MSLNKIPTEEECEAMQRVRNKIKTAGLTFDIVACVQLAKMFSHYNVEGFKIEKEEKELTQVD